MIRQCVLLLALATYSSALSGASQVGTEPYLGSIYASRLGGSATTDNINDQFPEILSITTKNKFIGQGSIISANMSITAASCFWDASTNKIVPASDVTLYAGSVNRATIDPAPVGRADATNSGSVPYPAKEIYIHPGFAYYPVSKIFENDIALVIPKTNFILNITDPGPHLISLPLTKTVNNTRDMQGYGVTPAWGKIGDGSGKPVDPPNTILQFINYTFTKHADCVKAYNNTHSVNERYAPYTVPLSTICMSTTRGKGYCQDDTGAALRIVDPKSKIPYIIGIASKTMTNKCPPSPAMPDLYTRVSHYLNWIYSKGGPLPRKSV